MRELTFIKDSNDYAWAKNMKRLLKETCKAVSDSAEKSLTHDEYKKVQKRYRGIITRGEKELPVIPEKPSGQRGKLAKSDAHNLWERLKNTNRRFSYSQRMGTSPLLTIEPNET